MEDYKGGDEAAFNKLVERYMNDTYRFVYNYCRNADEAEELTQDVFVKVWKNIRKFDTERNFKTWLLTIAKNTALDFLKRKRAIPLSSFETIDGGNIISDTLADKEPRADEQAYSREDAESAKKLVNSLEPDVAEIVRLRDFKSYSFREIAGILGRPLNTVKSTYRRALAYLRKNAPK